jgi:hypothetical protein
MADHSTTIDHLPPGGVETEEAFLADRQRFWGSFTHFTLGCVISIVVLLILMAIFLV